MSQSRLSRWIGPLPQPQAGFTGWCFLILIGGGLTYVLIGHPVVTIATVAEFLVLSGLLERTRARKVVTAAETRREEDIGSFARAFDRRGADPVDPWAIRAVWNALVPLTAARGVTIPLRPSDRVADDLLLDPDDLEDLIPLLVEQCERAPGNWRTNPYYPRIQTVADLVFFISSQPSPPSAAAPESPPSNWPATRDHPSAPSP